RTAGKDRANRLATGERRCPRLLHGARQLDPKEPSNPQTRGTTHRNRDRSRDRLRTVSPSLSAMNKTIRVLCVLLAIFALAALGWRLTHRRPASPGESAD